MRPHHSRSSLLPHGFARQWPCAGPCATASSLCRSSAWPCGHVPERALGGGFTCAGTAHVPAAVAGQRFPVLRVAMALASRWRHVLAAACTLMSTAPVGRLSTQLLGLKLAMCQFCFTHWGIPQTTSEGGLDALASRLPAQPSARYHTIACSATNRVTHKSIECTTQTSV